MIERKVTRTTAFRLMRLAGTTEDGLTSWTLSTGARLYSRRSASKPYRSVYVVSGYSWDGSDVHNALAMVGAKGRPLPMVSQS